MKKHMTCLFLMLLLLPLLSGCAGKDVAYAQASLPDPDAICIYTSQFNKVQVSYAPDSEEYGKLMELFRKTWWQTVPEEPELAQISQLVPAQSLSDLKTIQNRTYVQSGDIFVQLLYDSEPLVWTGDNGKTQQITLVAFLIPQWWKTEEMKKGAFTVSESGQLGFNEGWFTYYYPEETSRGIFNYLKS